MKRYETVLILLPELEEERVKEIIRKIEDSIKTSCGEVIKSDIWGEKPLAYKIKKRTRGIYVLIEYTGTSNIVGKLESSFKLNENIIRFLSVLAKEKKKRKRRKIQETKPLSPEPIAPVINDIIQEKNI